MVTGDHNHYGTVVTAVLSVAMYDRCFKTSIIQSEVMVYLRQLRKHGSGRIDCDLCRA